MKPPEHVHFFSRQNLEMLLSRCGFTTLQWMTRGKWTNGKFLTFKLEQMFPGRVAQGLASLMKKTPLAKTTIYIPSGDVQYIGAQKK